MTLKIYQSIEELPADPNLDIIADFAQVEPIVSARFKELTGEPFEFNVRIHSQQAFAKIPYVIEAITRYGAVPDGISFGLINLIDMPYHNVPYALYVLAHEAGHLYQANCERFRGEPFHDEAKATSFSEAFIGPVVRYYDSSGYGVRGFLDCKGNPAYPFVRQRIARGSSPMELFAEVRDCSAVGCDHRPVMMPRQAT